MDNIVSLITFVKANLTEILKVLAYVIAAASVVVRLTPTPKDNEVLAKLVKFLGKYVALNKDLGE